MALRPDRYHVESEVGFYCNETASRGIVMSAGSTSGSGVALDQTEAVVTAAVNPSGAKPIGLLMNDVVSVDLTQFHENYWADETTTGRKVTLWKKGWVVTDKVFPGNTPSVGATAYLGASGLVSTSQYGTAVAVGKFLSIKDEAGFVKLELDM